MTARDSVRMVSAFTAGDGKKPYATKQQAYYAIAKALVVAKYPAWLTSEAGNRPGRASDMAYREMLVEKWTRSIIELRTRKSFDLFWHQDVGVGNHYSGPRIPIYFDEKKWKSFVRRVAKYLQYVDERDDNDTDGVSDDDLQVRYEYAENSGVQWLSLAAKYRAELARRADARKEWSVEINAKLEDPE